MLTRASRGFTLIELLVTITIIGVMVALVMPSFSTMLQNGRLGAASKSYALGLQTARAEAIRRNLPVQFALTDTPLATGIENSAAVSPNGRNWVVRYIDPAASAAFTLVEAKSTLDSGTPVKVIGVATSPAGAVFDGTVTFNGFGATANSLAVQLDIQNNTAACATAGGGGGPMRCQRIQVRAGGQVNQCDPIAAPGDSRYCTAGL
jgi:type IV fimbrial biogenesis protein FimT